MQLTNNFLPGKEAFLRTALLCRPTFLPPPLHQQIVLKAVVGESRRSHPSHHCLLPPVVSAPAITFTCMLPVPSSTSRLMMWLVVGVHTAVTVVVLAMAGLSHRKEKLLPDIIIVFIIAQPTPIIHYYTPEHTLLAWNW